MRAFSKVTQHILLGFDKTNNWQTTFVCGFGTILIGSLLVATCSTWPVELSIFLYPFQLQLHLMKLIITFLQLPILRAII
jgi:hypothetical protein